MQSDMLKLRQLEGLINPSEFCRNGVNLWPLYRFYISEGFRNDRLGAPTLDRKTGSFLDQLKMILKGIPGIFTVLMSAKKADAVFLSSCNFQRFTLDGAKFDPYCYPVVTELNGRGMQSVVYQVGQPVDCNKSFIKTVNIENAINSWYSILAPLATIVMRLRLLFSDKTFLSSKVNIALESLGIDVKIPDDMFFIERAARLRIKALFFRLLLQKHAPSYGLMVGYGSGPGLAFTYACSLENIKSIELQHGMVSPGAARYADWLNVPIKGYELLPDTFWCWDKSEMINVYSWIEASPSHDVFPEGNLYLRFRQDFLSAEAEELKKKLQVSTKSYDHLCLVALQSKMVEPLWLMDAIMACNSLTLWIFKFHPSDQHKDERAKFIEHCFSERGLNNYDLISANQAALNIYDCIEEVDSVVSSFSSSLLEAMMLQKIPVIIHPEGVVHYQNEIDSGSMLLKSNRRDFVDYFNMPRKTDLAISDRSDSDNLEKIIDQIFTPKAK
jgi:hypothetical protein